MQPSSISVTDHSLARHSWINIKLLPLKGKERENVVKHIKTTRLPKEAEKYGELRQRVIEAGLRKLGVATNLR